MRVGGKYVNQKDVLEGKKVFAVFSLGGCVLCLQPV